MDEILFHLDVFLLMVSAAYDALARAVHLAYGFKGESRYASWRSSDWLKQLHTRQPRLWDLVSDGTETGALVAIIGILRNTVHQEPLHGVLEIGAESEVRAEVPEFLQADLKKAAGFFGTPDMVGLFERNAKWNVLTGRFVEFLTSRVFHSLNELMAMAGPPDPGHSLLGQHADDPDFGSAAGGSASLFLGLPFPSFVE